MAEIDSDTDPLVVVKAECTINEPFLQIKNELKVEIEADASNELMHFVLADDYENHPQKEHQLRLRKQQQAAMTGKQRKDDPWFSEQSDESDSHSDFETPQPRLGRRKRQSNVHETSDTNNGIIRSKILSGEYKLSLKRGRSKVWEFFNKIIDEDGIEFPNYVACKKCFSVLKYKASTSNLVRHKCYIQQRATSTGENAEISETIIDGDIERIDSTVDNSRSLSVEYENLNEMDAGSPEPVDSDTRIIRAKIQSGVYTLSNRPGQRSMAWDIFGTIIDENGEEFPHYASCRLCNCVLKYFNSTSNLMKHKCVIFARQNRGIGPEAIIDGETREKVATTIIEWIIENCRSYNICEDSGLKKLASVFIGIGANFGHNVNADKLMPNSEIIAEMLNESYQVRCESVHKEVSQTKQNGYSITCKMWTDENTKSSYISITMHYINDGVMNSRLMPIINIEQESSTGPNIKLAIADNLREFDCDLDVDDPIFITDPASNLTAAFQEYSSIHCINHLLSNIVEKAFADIDELSIMLRKANKLQKFLKNVEMPGIGCWNNIFYLFKAIETKWVSIPKDQKNDLDISIIISIISILSNFESCSKSLEGQTCPTLHLVIPSIHNLKKKCNSCSTDSEIEMKFKKVLKDSLDSIVVTEYHKIALFLFPPTNVLSQCNMEERNMIIECCKRITKKLAPEEIDNADVKSSITIQQQNSHIFSDFIPTNRQNSLEDRINREIQSYLNVEMRYKSDFDVLKWWNANKSSFPLLYNTSCKVLGTPASSAASEKVFSQSVGLLAVNDMACQIIFLNNHMR